MVFLENILVFFSYFHLFYESCFKKLLYKHIKWLEIKYYIYIYIYINKIYLNILKKFMLLNRLLFYKN